MSYAKRDEDSGKYRWLRKCPYSSIWDENASTTTQERGQLQRRA